MIKPSPTYSDLDLNFKPHPLTGDISPKTDVEAVRRAIRMALFLDKFDIPFDRSKKSSLSNFIFEQNTHITEVSLRKSIEWVFKNLEPRANLEKIDIVYDSTNMGYDITVWYTIRSLNLQDNIQFFYAQRVR